MNESTKIRVFSVDDHPLLHEGIAAVIRNQPDMLLVGEASNGREAVQQFRQYAPDGCTPRHYKRVSGLAENFQKFCGEYRIPVVDQVLVADQEAFRDIREVACHLAHPGPVRLPRQSGDPHPPARQLDEEEHQEPR